MKNIFSLIAVLYFWGLIAPEVEAQVCIPLTVTGGTLTGTDQYEFCCGSGGLSLSVPNDPGSSYQWFEAVGGGTPIAFANSNSFKPVGAGNYYVVVTLKSDPSKTCQSKTMDINCKQGVDITITPVDNILLKPDPNVNKKPDGTYTICCGLTTYLLVETNPISPSEWQYEKVLPAPPTNIPRIVDTESLECKDILFTVGARNLTTGCSVNKDIFIKVLNVNGGLIKESQIICEGDIANKIVSDLASPPSGGDGAYAFQWYQSTTSCDLPGDFAIIPGAQSEDYSPGALTQTTYFRREAKIPGCGITSLTFSKPFSNCVTVTVDKKPVISSPNTKEICTGSNVDYTPTSNISGATFEWTATVTSGTITGVSSGIQTGSISDKLDLPSGAITSGTVKYTITPTGPAPTFCPGLPVVVTVTVNPIPNVKLSDIGQTICSGATTANVTLTSGVANVSWDWHTNQLADITPEVNGTTAFLPPQKYVSTLPGTEYVVYSIVATGPGTSACSSSAATYMVTVNPSPTVINSPMEQSICSGGSSTEVVLETNVPGTTFTWSASANPSSLVFSPATGGATIPVTTITNPTNILGTVTYVITPSGSSGSCPATSRDYLIKVYPKPLINSLLIADVCSHSPFSYNITSNVTGSTFHWYRAPVTGIQVNPGIDGSSINETLVNTTNSPIDVTYVLTPTGPDPLKCIGVPSNLVVTVKPRPQVFAGTDKSVNCGTSIKLSDATATGGTGAITNVAWVPSSEINGPSDILNPTTKNLTVTQDFVLTVTDAGTCSNSDAVKVTVTGNCLEAVPSATPQSICVGQSSNLNANATGGSGFFTYSWTSNPIGTTSDKAIFSVIPIVTTIYTVVVDDGFSSVSRSITVTVNPLPTLYNVTGGGEYCSGGAGVPIGLDGSELNVDYQLCIGGIPIVGSSPVHGTGSAITFGNITTAGTYTVKATNIVTNCQSDMTGSTDVIINPLPSANAGPDQTIKFGTSTTLAGVASGGTGTLSYTWEPAIKIASLQNTVLTPATVKLFANTTYTLTVTDQKNCQKSDPVEVFMDGSALDVSLGVTPAVICNNGSQISLTATPTGGSGNYTFLWTNNDGSRIPMFSSTDQNPTDKPTFSTIYNLVVSDGYNTVSKDIPVTVNQLPTPFNVTGGGDYCPGGPGLPVDLDNSEVGVTYQLKRGGINFGSPIPGTGSAISFGLQTAAFTYTVDATNTVTLCSNAMTGSAIVTILPLPELFTVTGGGAYPTGGSGVEIGLSGSQSGVNYQLLLNNVLQGAPISGTGSAITFGDQMAQGTYLVVGSNPSTTCLREMLGSATVTINPTPTLFKVSGGGQRCFGGLGLPIELSGSENNIRYELLLNSKSINPAVALDGTGAPLKFALQLNSGIYTIKAVNKTSNVSLMMNGSPTIVENPLPVVYAMVPPANICLGESIYLNGSELGVDYLLMNGLDVVKTLPGTGATGLLNFGIQNNPGTYRIVGRNRTTLCEIGMDGTVVVNPAPDVFTVNPPGIICIGTSITLTGSQSGINYQLRRDSLTNAGAPVQGTGSALVFGPQLLPGVYRVIAINPVTRCYSWMNGRPTIQEPPVIYSMIPSGTMCADASVRLNGSEKGMLYKLMLNNSIPLDSILGDGNPILFGTHSTSGAYTILGINLITRCQTLMDGALNLLSTPIAYNILPKGIECTDSSIGLDNSELGVNYKLILNGKAILTGPVPGTGSAISFGIQSLQGDYTIEAINSATGCSRVMNGTATLSLRPVQYVVQPQGTQCSGSDIYLNGSQVGVNYKLYRDGILQLTLPGTGFILNFGPQILSGTYTIIGNDPVTACETQMSGNMSIVPLPLAFNITPSGANCSPATIGLSSSQTGVDYQLYNSLGLVGFTVPGANKAITFGAQTSGTYYIIGTNNSTGCKANMSGTVLINPQPTVNAGIDESMCIEPASTITITGTATSYDPDPTKILWEDLMSEGTFTNPNSLVTGYRPNATPGKRTLRLTVSGINGCNGVAVSDTKVIEVYILPISNAGPDQVICENSTATMTGTIGGKSKTGIWTTNGTGLTGSFDDPTKMNAIYSPGAADVSAGKVTLTLTTTDGSPCAEVSDVMDLIINPIPRLTSALAPPAICSGTKFNYIPTSQVTGTTFTWNRSIVAGIHEGANTNTGNPNETLTNETSAPINVTYVYTLKTINCTNPATYEVVVTVNPTPTLSSALTAPAICSGSTFSYIPTSLTHNTIFEWRRLLNVGINGPGTSGTGNPNEVLTNLTEVPVNVTYRYTLTANNCTNAAFYDVIVTVNPTPLLSSTLTPPAICSGTKFSYVPTSLTTGTIFAWDRKTTSGITEIGKSSSGNPNEVLTNHTPNPINVNYAYTLAANNCANETSYNVVVTVNPTPLLSSSLTPPAICSGTAFNYTPTSNTVGTTYMWKRAKVTGITEDINEGPNNPNEILTNSTPDPIDVTYTYTLTANNCTNASTYNVVVTVNPTPLLSSTLKPSAICSGTTFSYIPTSSTKGTVFAWNRKTTSGITELGKSDSGNPNEILTNATSDPIDVTYEYTLSANNCTNASTYKVVVTVNPTPQLSSKLDPPAICSGTAFSYVPTSATTGTTFEYFRQPVLGILPMVGKAGFGNPNEILINETSDPIDVTYEYTLTANICTDATKYYVVVTVNPTPLLSSTLKPPAICSGATFSYVPTSSTVGTTFRWLRGNINGIIQAGKTGTGNPNEILTNTTPDPIFVTYEYTLTANDCTNSTKFLVVVTVNPIPLLSSSLTPPAICSGMSFSYTPTSMISGTTFAWERKTTSGISEIGNSGFFNPNEILTNTTSAPIDVIYEYSLTANNCTNATKFNVIVTVNPIPLLSSTLAPLAICSGTVFSYIPTSLTTGTNFAWKRITISGITEIGKAGFFNPNEVLTNETAVPIDVIYEYTLTANNCTNATKYNVVVTVNPKSQLTSTLRSPAICSGSTFSYIPTSLASGTRFEWFRRKIDGISQDAKTGIGNPTEVLTNTTPSPIDVTYEYTLSANNCTNATKYNVIVTVNPKPLLSSTLTPPAICSGTKFNYLPTSLTVGTTFEWTRYTRNGIQKIGTSGFGDPNEVLTNLTTDTIHVVYNYLLVANNCANLDTFKVIVTVNPTALLTSTLSAPAICSGTAFSYIPTSTTAGTTFEWNRGSMSEISEMGSPGLGNINEVLTNKTSNPVNVTYVYTLKANGCTNPTTYNVVVTVNPTPQLTSTLTPSVICSGTKFNYLPTSWTAGTSFVWNRTSPGITPVSNSGPGDPNELLTNNTSAPIKVTYVYTLTANNCTNPVTSNVVVTVNPRGQVNIISDQAKCVGDQTDLVAFTSVNTGGGSTFEWNNNEPTIGLLQSGIGNILPFKTINGGKTPKDARVTVTPYFTNEGLTCIGDNRIINIRVFSTFNVGSVSGNQINCYNSVPAKLIGTVPTGGDLNYAYQWQYSINGGIDWNNVIVNGNSLDYQPYQIKQKTLFHQIQTSQSCGSLITDSVTVDVLTATAFAGPNDTICGLIPYPMSLATATYASNYTWTTSGTGTFTGKYLLNSTYFPSTRDMNLGSVVLTLTISDDCGNNFSDDMTLVLGQLPAAYFSYSTPTCAKTPVRFTDQSQVSNGYINKWVWDFGDGNADTIVYPKSPDVLHTFATPGPSYNVKLKVFTSLGCTAEFTNVVKSVEVPYANFSFPDLLCDNLPVQFTNTTQINGALGMQPWSWNFGDPLTGSGNTSNLQNPAHQFSASGDYIVKLTVQNTNNCLGTITDTISVRLRPSVDFTIGKTCLKDQVVFDPDPVKTDIKTISSWFWDFGDGATSDLRNTVHIYKAPGIYTVVLTVTDITGCSNTISHVVLVNPLPSAHFDTSIADCENSIVLFNTHTSTSEGYIVKWTWDFGDGTGQTVNYPDNASILHKYSKEGNYNVTLSVVTSVGCSNSESLVVSVLPVPLANFGFSTACLNMPVLFKDLSQTRAGGDIVKWNWNFGDAESGVNNVSTLKDPSHTYVGTGPFKVTLTVTNYNGCKNTTNPIIVAVNPKPFSKFTPSVTRCEGDLVTFTNTSTSATGSTITSSLWNFGDNISSAEFSPSHTFVTSGAFNVKLIVSNSIGCMDTLFQQVTVNPKPVVDFSASETRCVGSPVTFTDHTFVPTGFTGAIKTWVWDFGDGTPLVTVNFPDNQNVSHTFAGSATSYRVKLTSILTTGCTGFKENDVTLNPSPIANFNFSKILCENQAVSFTDLSSENGGGSIQTWSWNFGDPLSGVSNISTRQNPSHSFTRTGSYKIVLSVTNANGCDSSATRIISISPNPVAKFTPSVTRCESDPVTFTNESETSAGTTFSSYSWDFGDNVTSSVSSPLHIFTTSGTFPVKLIVTNSNGCTGTDTTYVSVNPKPVVDFSFSPVRCYDNPVTFTSNSFIPKGFTGSIKKWVWNFGDGTAPITIDYPTSPNFSHSFKPGNSSYTVRLTVYTTTGCSGFSEKPVLFNVSPGADFSYTNILCDNQPVRFTDKSSSNGGGNIESWAWNFGDLSSGVNNLSSLQHPFHSFSGTGLFTVSLTVTNNNGCQNTKSYVIDIKPRLDAKFTFSTTRCQGETITFNDASITPAGTAITSHKWYFGDGETSTLVSPTHIYKIYGTFNVILSVTNSAGCTIDTMQQLTVTPKPVADFAYSAIRCSGTPVTFTDHSHVTTGFNGFINSWTWDFGDGSIPVTFNYPSTSPNVVHTFSAGASSYRVRLTVTTTYGCSGYTDSVLVVTTAGFVGTYGPYCLSDSPAKLSVDPSGGTFSGPGVQGNYFYPANAGVSNPNLPHTITYTSPVGTCPVAPIKIEVVSSPAVKTTDQLLASCNGTADLTLPAVTVGSTAGLYFTYFTDPQALKPVDNPKAVSLGTYYIRGATLSGKCATIQPITVLPSVPLQVTLTSVSPQCSGSASGSITVLPVNGTPPYLYQLNSSPAQTSPIFRNLKAGDYSVTATDVNSCTTTVSITIRDNPNAKIVISHKDILCANDANGSARVESINGIAAATTTYIYSWNTTPVQTGIEARQLTKGVVTVTATDSKGCGIKDSVMIAVLDKEPPTIVCRKDTVSIILQASASDPLSNNNSQNAVAVELVKPVVSDNCGIASLTNDAPAKFRVGVVTPVLWTVTDLVGLTDTCTTYVYVKRIPTVQKLLTPNGDGLNDYFVIDGLKDFPKSQLSIFTRGGQLVFTSEDYNNDWDCRFTTSKWSHNQFVTPGVYYYVLNLGGTKQKLQGFIYVSY